MLLTQKALVEGGRLLSLHAYSQLDIAEKSQRRCRARTRGHLVGFLTPISKACLTEWSIENTYNAVQCFGGHGYIAEHGMEQLARDARITTLYEGTTGIQALDLIGRKTAATQGAGLKLFLAEVEAFAKQHEGDEALAEFIAGTAARQGGEWGKLTIDVLQRAASNPEETRRRQHRLPVLFRLRGAGLLVGAQRGRRQCVRPPAVVQGRQARHRPFLLRPPAAAHAGPQGGDRKRRGTADVHAGGRLRGRVTVTSRPACAGRDGMRHRRRHACTQMVIGGV
jgi:hypothetical protein